MAASLARRVVVADEDGAGLGGGLDAAGGVDEVAGDHALVGGTQRDGRLAGEDAGARSERGVEARDRVDEVEGGAHGAFGVVLVRDGGAPDGHHGVADELLDGAAVALDHGAAGVEVAGQQLAGVLGVAPLRGGREADEVGEQHAHQPALRHRRDPFRRRGGTLVLHPPQAPSRTPSRSARRARPPGARGAAARQPRPALGAEPRGVAVLGAAGATEHAPMLRRSGGVPIGRYKSSGQKALHWRGWTSASASSAHT